MLKTSIDCPWACRAVARNLYPSRLLCLGLIALGLGLSAPADSFPTAQIQRAYNAITPSLCVVSFTAEITNPSTGEIGTRQTESLGVIVSPDGLILGHGHMRTENIEPTNIRVTIGYGDGEREYEADYVGKPGDVNLSFLRLRGNIDGSLPYVRFRSGQDLQLGEPVLLFGLMGESLDRARSILTRRIGAILEHPRTTYGLDSPVNFGFVTSPAVTASGELAGVVGFDMAPQEGGDLHIRSGHPLVYQTELFEHYIQDPEAIIASEKTEPDAWLGVFTQPLTDDLAEYWGLDPQGGVVISTIMQGSPAESAGFHRGDIITLFNETPVRARQDRDILAFTQLIRREEVGATVPIRFLRDGEPMQFEVTLGERPRAARDAGEYEDDIFGLTVREITSDLRLRLNIPEDVQGVIVHRVRSGSWANLAGMRPGVIVMNFGGHVIETIEDFSQAVQAVAEAQPSEIAVFSRVGPQTGFFRLAPRWNRQDTE